ncbi:MAG: extracellular solute-binding protein, partial [Anaeroplasmataceae bacterium]|nr:extracellular solute-binding protein [Anaeroplasmataceae bacterium]
MKKRLFALAALGVLSLGLAGCDGSSKGNTVELVYSGTQSDKDFTMKLIDNFKEMKKAAGDDTNYVIDYVAHGPDKVDSEIIDWTAANSPDVYEYAPDKLAILYDKGALAEIRSTYKDFIDTKINDFGKINATLNGKYYGYPYTGDNTYYFQYDKRIFTSEEDVKSIERILEICEEKGYKLGYNLEEAFWGAGVMFTFGADYSIEFDRDGKIAGVQADFNTSKGLKGAKAIVKIMSSPAWTNDMVVPTDTNKIAGCMAGTWDIAAYKDALGNNYACAPMPTVTIDGETKNLGAFVGGKLLGVNPLRAQNDVKRLTAAHELAMFLAGEECQTKRYNELSWGPCNVDSLKKIDEKPEPDLNMVTLNEQLVFGHAQTSTPSNLWEAAGKLVAGIKDGTYSVEGKSESGASVGSLTFTNETLQVAIDTYNNA